MTKIEWCDETINPIIGCSKISPACDHCYAERMAARLATMPQTTERYAGVTDGRRWTGRIRFHGAELAKPKKWKSPKRIFVGSMTDVFHENTPVDWIWACIQMACDNPQHTFMFLTKRPDRMFDVLTSSAWWNNDTPHNVWLGVTVENQAMADARIPILMKTPAARRFLSIEPMLGPINLYRIVYDNVVAIDCLHGLHGFSYPHAPVSKGISPIDWVIVGGENGYGARPMHPTWAWSIHDQCEVAKVPFFFKGWGEWAPHTPAAGGDLGGDLRRELSSEPDGRFRYGDRYMRRVGKQHSGRLLGGREWNAFPTTEVTAQ